MNILEIPSDKEIRDQIVYGGFDRKDLVATIAEDAVMQMFIWFGL